MVTITYRGLDLERTLQLAHWAQEDARDAIRCRDTAARMFSDAARADMLQIAAEYERDAIELRAKAEAMAC